MPRAAAERKMAPTELWLRRIEPGTFTMGSPYGEKGRDYDLRNWEKPHKVTLTKPYYIGVFEITQKQNQMIGQYKSFKDSENNTRPLHSTTFQVPQAEPCLRQPVCNKGGDHNGTEKVWMD